MKLKGDTTDAQPYQDYACFADGYSSCIRNIQNNLIVYAVIVHQTNISYSNEVRSAKHV